MVSQQTTFRQACPLGIDLGTTYSVVAYVEDDGRPTTLHNSLGELLTPSAVLFDESEVVVGREAVKASAAQPTWYADSFKRDMGSLVYRRKVRQREVPPEVLSAFVLRKLRAEAEQQLGSACQAVITVPAFFDETRRRATQDAAQLAGLHVLDIINEPTAAALAFAFQRRRGETAFQPDHERVMVYDLGGGTFDVSIVEVAGQRFRTIATDGDVQLGGKDFDQRLVDFLAEQFVQAHGADPRSDPADVAQLWREAQDVKHALTQRQRASATCYHAGIRLRAEVTRQQFVEMTSDLLARTETTARLVLKQAALAWRDINRVLLVGGATRMPMVSQMLHKLTGREPQRTANPDEIVAHGAALYAAMISQTGSPESSDSYQIVNVNAHSLGVVGVDPRTKRRTNVILIPKNQPLPCQTTRGFQTARDGQRSVRVAVVEGESRMPQDCIALGECVVRDLPPGLPKGTRVEVQYRYASNGRISVSARIPQTRQSARVEIARDQPRRLEDLSAWEARLCGAQRPEFSTESVDQPSPVERADVIRRLDELYSRLGRSIAGAALPLTLRRSATACRAAEQELVQAQHHLAQLSSELAQVAAAHEAKKKRTELVRAQEQLQRAQTKSDFSFLVLGRECILQDHAPPGFEQEVNEIHRLRKQLQQTMASK